ncbi:MAG: hemolysin family protein, partial [Bacteroidota bacterium]
RCNRFWKGEGKAPGIRTRKPSRQSCFITYSHGMNPFWVEILLIFLLVVISSVFAAGEVAILSTSAGRVRELVERGVRSAKTIHELQRDPDRLIATVHIGRSVVITLAAAVAGSFGIQYLQPVYGSMEVSWIQEWSHWLALLTVVMVVTYLIIVFGALIPKSIALKYPEPVALIVALPIRWFSRIFYFLGRVFTGSSNQFLKVFKDQTSFAESRISENGFKLMLEEGTKTGVIDKTEQELIKRIFKFTDTTAKAVMIARPDIVAVDINTAQEKLIKQVIEEGYSRLPVYKETIDNIIGVLYTKDLIALLEHRNVVILQDILRPAYFVPESIKISQLMRGLEQRRVHLAVVIDEFGGTEGIVTMEDLLEEIVGEIHDEYDEERREYERAADGSLVVNARMSVRDFNAKFGTDIPEDEDYETISGFLHKLTGRIPGLHEEIRHKSIVLSVIKKSKRRIRKVRVRTVEKAGRLRKEDVGVRSDRL